MGGVGGGGGWGGANNVQAACVPWNSKSLSNIGIAVPQSSAAFVFPSGFQSAFSHEVSWKALPGAILSSTDSR